MDARCNGNAKLDCKQNDSKTFRINFDQRWWCCCCCIYVKHQKQKTETSTHINSIKNLVLSTQFNSSSVIIWFIYFIKSFPLPEPPPYSSFALYCITPFIGSFRSLINNNEFQEILLQENENEIDAHDSKLDSMQIPFLNCIIVYNMPQCAMMAFTNWLLRNWAIYFSFSVHYFVQNANVIT